MRTSGSRSPIVLTPAKTLPVIEIFGPTVQGEGRLVGTPCYFVRLGACDFKCSWCDSPHAVDPKLVRKNARHITAEQIVDELAALPSQHEWIIISGGNPALHDLSPLCKTLKGAGYKLALETQGSKLKSWFDRIDLLTLSPKPPSSGMKMPYNVYDAIVQARLEANKPCDIKIVCFDGTDYEFAKSLIFRTRKQLRDYRKTQFRFFLSVGTYVNESSRDDLLDRSLELVEQVTRDPDMIDVGVLPQYHVLLWGHKQGV